MTSNMKVHLFTSVPLAPPWDQGDKNLAYMLARSLSPIQFEVLSARQAPNPAGENLLARPLYRSRRPSLIEKASVYAWLLSRSSASSPDLYHLIYRPTTYSSLLFNILPEFKRRPTIHTVPATADSRLNKSSLFFADRVVALSRYGKQQLTKLGLTNVEYIPTGIVPDPWLRLQGQEAAYKDQLGLSGSRVIFYPGHFGPGYGTDLIMKALPELVAEIPDLKLIFACRVRSPQDLEREAAYEARLERSGFRDRVLIYRTVEDITPLLGASDVVVLPLNKMRDKLDIPTTLLEALAAAKPVIISDLPPMNEILNPSSPGGKTQPGILFSPGDVKGFQEAVVEIMDNANWRSRMGQAGATLIQEKYDIQRVAARYLKLYEQASGVKVAVQFSQAASPLVGPAPD